MTFSFSYTFEAVMKLAQFLQEDML